MPDSATTTAMPSSRYLFSYAHVSWMSASPGTTWCNQCSSRWVESVNGSWMNPPTIDSPARTTSGINMIHGDSWGLT